MAANRTLDEYLALIPPPNNGAPKFMQWLADAVQLEVETQTVLQEIVTAFNLDTAEGVQLDIIGELLAQPREVDFDPGGGFTPILNDLNYRIVLKAKILKNIWKGTKAEIYDFWAKFFPDNPVLIQDNQNMTMTVLVINAPSDIDGTVTFAYDTDTATLKGYDEGYWEGFQNLIRGLIINGYYTPKPSGVAVTYQFLETPAFAYDTDIEYLKGYDESEWAYLA